MASQGGSCLAWQVQEVLASYGKSASFFAPSSKSVARPTPGLPDRSAAATAQLLVRRPLLPGQPALVVEVWGGRGGSGPQVKRGHCQGPYPGVPQGPLGTRGPALGYTGQGNGGRNGLSPRKGTKGQGLRPQKNVCSSGRRVYVWNGKLWDRKLWRGQL